MKILYRCDKKCWFFLITTHDFLHYHAVKPYPTPFITPTPNAASSSASPQYPPRGEVVCFRAGYFVFVWLPPAIYAISRPTRIEITPQHAPQCAFLCKIFIFFIKYLHKKKKRPIFALALRHEALKWWCHSSVGRAKDWKSLCPRFDSWWHHLKSLPNCCKTAIWDFSFIRKT